MSFVRRVLVLACALALGTISARAAVLIHAYALRGSLADDQGNTSLTALGGQITAFGYVFSGNRGLTLTSSLLNPTSFSLEFSFRLHPTDGYGKIADFHDLLANTGLYNHDGHLEFYPSARSSALDFTTGMNTHVVLTRDDTTGLVVGYVDGQQRFSFVDNSGLAAVTSFNHRLTFFVDDLASGLGDAPNGTLNFLRIYNGALTASEVSALYAAGTPLTVPEPTTLALLATGGAAWWWLRRPRPRR